MTSASESRSRFACAVSAWGDEYSDDSSIAMDEPPSVICLRALMRARTAFPSGGDNDAGGGEIDAGVADKADAAGSCVGLKIEKKPSTNPGRGAR